MAMATATKATWNIDETWNAVHIFFNAIPDVKIRDKMKALGFKWHKKDKYWFAKQNDKRIALAKKICKGYETEETKPKIEETKPKTEEPKPENELSHGVQIGDIFSLTWGYDQTNVDFFQAVKVTAQSCKVREVVPKVILREAESPMSANTTYEITRDILQPIPRSVFIKKNDEGETKRIKTESGKPEIKIGQHYARLVPQGENTFFTSWWA